MQLDRTRIVIRKRGWLESFDMAFSLIRVLEPRLWGYYFLGVLPFFILNYFLLLNVGDLSIIDESNANRNIYFPYYHVFLMTFLVYLEMPLASSLTVIFLGKDIFLEKHSLNGILSELWEGLGRLLYSHLVWRFLFLGLSITYFLRISIVSPETISNDVGTWIGWVFLFFFVAWILRLFRPFINEVILLEKLPARNQEDKGRTLAKRSSSLHNANLGTLLLQGIYSFFLAIFLSWALISGLTFLRGILFANWYWDDLTLNFLYPGVLWVVGLYFTVWRFLCYLNIRIRDEGWEIELLMRAEATRLRERRFGFKSH